MEEFENIGHGAIEAASAISKATFEMSSGDALLGTAIVCNAILKSKTSDLKGKDKTALKKLIRTIVFDGV